MEKFIVITGASSGIGWAAAKQFAARQKNLILIARREDKLLHLKQELISAFPALEVIVIPFDLTCIDQLPSLFSDLETFNIEAWINNAGFGYYSQVRDQELTRTRTLLQLNVEALTILSLLYVQKYQSQPGTQLINISSAGGYTMVPNAVTYCASKFYVSAFTEGLALELRQQKAPLQAKVLAPAATKTSFGMVANDNAAYDYDQAFARYHTKEEMAQFLMELYDSDSIVGSIDRETFAFKLETAKFPSAFHAAGNQRTSG